MKLSLIQTANLFTSLSLSVCINKLLLFTHKTHVIHSKASGMFYPMHTIVCKEIMLLLGRFYFPHLCLIIFTADLWVCATVPALSSGAEGVKFWATGELKGTGVHVAKPLLLWERGQTEEEETPLSPSLTNSHFHSLHLHPSASAPSIPRSAREPGWLEIQMTNESTQLLLSSPLHFSNETHSLSPLLSETSPFRLLPSIRLSFLYRLSTYMFFKI